MALPSEDDRDAIDRAFAELVAGYHLTADQPDPRSTETSDETAALADGLTSSAPDAADGATRWAADHPLFGFLDRMSLSKLAIMLGHANQLLVVLVK